MEAFFLELIHAIIAFVLEITVHAAIFIFLMLMSIFSPRYRKKLKEKWNTSNRRRFTMVLGISLYATALFVALAIWIPAISGNQDSSENSENVQLNDLARELMEKVLPEQNQPD